MDGGARSEVPVAGRPAIEAALAARAPAPPRRRALIHGDLGAEHVFVDDGRISGVIDWGDAAIGDPALDHGRLLRDFGAVPDGERARLYADLHRARGPRVRARDRQTTATAPTRSPRSPSSSRPRVRRPLTADGSCADHVRSPGAARRRTTKRGSPCAPPSPPSPARAPNGSCSASGSSRSSLSFSAGVPEKYTDAQENESTSFLPGDAESTKALTAAEDLQGGELAPAVILYRRESRADRGRQGQDHRGRRAPHAAALRRRRGRRRDGGRGRLRERRARAGAAADRGLRRPDDADPGAAERLRAVRRTGVFRGRQGRTGLRLRPRRRRRRDAAGPGAVLARDGLGPGRRARGQDHRRRRLRRRRDRGLREHQRHAAVRGDAAGDRAADPDLPVADLPLHPARRGHLRRVPVADAGLRAGRGSA